MLSRAGRFLFRFFLAVLGIGVAGLILFLLQGLFGLFNSQLAFIRLVVNETDATLSQNIFTGISLGALVLLGFVVVFPLFHSGVNNRQYLVGIQRGVVSAGVYFLSEYLFKWLGTISRFYMVFSIILVVIVAFILIEVIALSAPKKEEVGFRTDIIAAVVAGLLFGVILKLLMIGMDFVKGMV